MQDLVQLLHQYRTLRQPDGRRHSKAPVGQLVGQLPQGVLPKGIGAGAVSVSVRRGGRGVQFFYYSIRYLTKSEFARSGSKLSARSCALAVWVGVAVRTPPVLQRRQP
jgi:hypothetical protein